MNRDGFMDLLVLHWCQELFFDDKAQAAISDRLGTAGIVSVDAPSNWRRRNTDGQLGSR